ncbi:hypothetical protein C5167_027406 [Papaver somniferum]|nr:hypothetical protein C5167_027406 [Papaver somniferum]
MSGSDPSSPNSPVHDNISSQNNETLINSSALPRTLDPYIIHPSDNPATVLSYPLLQGDNYGSWVRGIIKSLNAKGKLGFVDGSLPPPTDPLQFQCWKRCDDLVGSWLLKSCQPDIRASCLYAANSHAILKDLQIRFCVSNAPILFRLKSSIASIKQESMHVSLYYTKIKTLWDQYDSLVASTEACICGAGKHMLERLERERAMEFLQGLHDRFSNLRSQILTMDPFPSAIRIFNLVQQEEEQQHLTHTPLPTVDAAALASTRNFQSIYRPPSNQKKRQRPFCDYCNRLGHVRDNFYRLHAFPPANSSQQQPLANANLHMTAAAAALSTDPSAAPHALPSLSGDQYALLLALINPAPDSAQPDARANFAGNILSTSIVDPWFVDSGATHHICNSLHYFTSYIPVQSSILMQLPDGSFSVVKHIGEVVFSPTLKLSNDRVTKAVIGQADFISGLYHLQAHPHQSFNRVLCNKTTADVWYYRLGYPHNQKGYIILDISTKTTFVSRDVVFHEHLFPFKDAKFTSDTVLPLSTDTDFFYEDSMSVSHSNSVIDIHSPNLSPLPVADSTSPTHILDDHTSHTTGPILESTSPDISSTEVTSTIDTNLRRSTRTHTRPSHLKDYVCSVSKGMFNSLYPLKNYISFDKFTPQHRSFLSSVISNDEPRSFTEAIKHPDRRDAIVKEHTALLNNDTFTMTTLPPGKSAIGCK